MNNTSANTNIIQGQNNIVTNTNINEPKNSKSQQDTLYQLCQALLRFINRKIVKKYIFPNEAQLPKEKRGLELRANNIWKYYLNNDVTEEEKIKDVFKDDKFLLSLQKMTNSLNEVIALIESNQRKMKMMEERSRNKEEKINALSEINDLLSSFFKNKEKGENSNKNNKNEDIILDNILEKMKDFYSLQKYHEDSIENKNNENLNKNDENHSVINNSELTDKNINSSEKNELDILIQNFRLDEIKEPEKENTEIKEKKEKEKKEEIKDENIFLNKKTEREIKSKNNKNKHKKKKNKEKSENKENIENKENKINIKEDQEKVPIQKEKINIPILKPKEEKKEVDSKETKKEDDIDEDIINQLLENEVGENSNPSEIGNSSNKQEEKKQKINIDLLPKDSKEEKFDAEIRKNFTGNKRPKKDNNLIKELKNIINALEDSKIQEMKNYNERISGPYLSGSFKTFRNLCGLNYQREIDLIYTYRDMLLNQDIINYSVKEVLENYLKLNIIKSSEIKEEEIDEENKKVIIEVECSSKKLDKNDIIKFNILFIDSGIGFNEKIIEELIQNKKEFLVKTEEEKFMNICLFLRVWRRKNQLFYIIPEILDELARKYLRPDKSMLTVVLNIIYDLYNQFINFYQKDSNSFVPASKQLCEDILKDFFRKENAERIKDLKEKILKVADDIQNQKYEEIFKI